MILMHYGNYYTVLNAEWSSEVSERTGRRSPQPGGRTFPIVKSELSVWSSRQSRGRATLVAPRADAQLSSDDDHADSSRSRSTGTGKMHENLRLPGA